MSGARAQRRWSTGRNLTGNATNRKLRSSPTFLGNLTDLILWPGWLRRQINELDFRIIA
jgi:hypothetical protein